MSAARAVARGALIGLAGAAVSLLYWCVLMPVGLAIAVWLADHAHGL